MKHLLTRFVVGQSIATVIECGLIMVLIGLGVHHGLGASQRVTRAPTRFSEQDRISRDDRGGSQPRTA